MARSHRKAYKPLDITTAFHHWKQRFDNNEITVKDFTDQADYDLVLSNLDKIELICDQFQDNNPTLNAKLVTEALKIFKENTTIFIKVGIVKIG